MATSDYLNQITGGMAGGSPSASSTPAPSSSSYNKYRPTGFGLDSSKKKNDSKYQTEPSRILDVKNVKKWESKVPQSGLVWNPNVGQYVFRDASGNLKKTSDFGTAFNALGLTEENPAEAMIARNQNFDLKGAAVQFNPKTNSYMFRDPASGKIMTSPSLTTAYNILNPRPVTTPVDPTVRPDIILPNGTRLKDTGATPPIGYRPTADSPQYYQPVYRPTHVNRAREGYSLFQQPMSGGIGEITTPFNPQNPEAAAAPAEQGMAYGGLAGIGALSSPFRRSRG